MEPPDPPEPIVNLGMPYCSTKRSLIIINVSAETTSSQPLPSVFRVPKATAKPRLSGSCESAEVTRLRPDRYAGPQPPANGKLSLPFQPGPGFLPPGGHGVEGGAGGAARMVTREVGWS